jgi:nucleoside phosphorylase
MLKSVLEGTPYRALELLAGTDTPVSGRSVAAALRVAPTTATSALGKLRESGFATAERVGRAEVWRLNTNSPVVRSWLEEIRGVVAPLSERPQQRAVILTALPEEYASVGAHLSDRQPARVGTTRYEQGRFKGTTIDWTVYTAEIGMGNAATAGELAAATAAFSPDVVLFVGVAGSVKPDDLTRGDVVIGSHAYNVHSGKDTVDDAGRSVSLGRPLSFPAARGLVQLATSVRRQDWTGELVLVGPGEFRNARGDAPHVEIKGIAAGEVVHGDVRSALMDKVRTTFNDVAAVDMESFGLYESAHRLSVPALVVRGISDGLGDKNPADDARWQPIAARHAAGFAFAMLRAAEVEDLGARPTPSTSPAGTPVAAIQSIDDALFRLPPAVAVAYEGALRAVGEKANTLVEELATQEDQWESWLRRFQRQIPPSFSAPESGPLWILAAAYADAHHATSAWLYAQAAEHTVDNPTRAFLYGRGALSAAREGDRAAAIELLSKAEAMEPGGGPLWELHRAGIDNDGSAILSAVGRLIQPVDLEFLRPALGEAFETSSATNEQLLRFLDDLAANSPEMFEHLRFFVALSAGVAFQITSQLPAAQLLFETLTAGMPSSRPRSPGNAVRGSLIGPRTATVITQLARTLCARAAAPGGPEPGFESDRALVTASELALTARDRLLDWHGPTADALQIAAMSRSRAGDARGALSLLVAPPRGTARPSEASAQPVVSLAAELAAATGQIELAFELAKKIEDRIERHIATGLAYLLRENCRPEAVAEFRHALSDPAIKDRPDQQIRSVLALSMVEEPTDAEIAVVEGFDRQTADLIRAQAHATAGRGTQAQILARRYPSSEAAVQIRVQVLLAEGQTAEAIQTLEDHAAQHDDERFLEQASMLALSADRVDDAERLARQLAGSRDPHRRRVAGEVLVETASRMANWDRVLTESRRLIDDAEIAANDPDRAEHLVAYRWARTQAYYQLRRLPDAYDVIRQEPFLNPTSQNQARLVLSVLHFLAPSVLTAGDANDRQTRTVTQAEVLANVTAIAQAFPDDEEIVATALMISLALRIETPADPAQLAQARALQEQFFERFPDSQQIRRIPLDDTLSDITEMLRTQLAPGAELAIRMRRAAWAGQVPLSVYATSLRKSYADALVRNALDCYVIEHPDPQIALAETAAATDALNNTVVVDTSTLFLADTAFGDLRDLRSRFDRLLLPAPQRDDVLAARGPLQMRSPFSMGWDPFTNRPTMTQTDEATNQLWATDADRLALALDLCEVVPDPPYDGEQAERLWSSPIRVAKDRGVALLADDAALRATARTEGVPAFSSLHVLHALVTTGDLEPAAIEAAYQRLMAIHAADLPLRDRIREIAARDDWRPTSYAAFLLARPSTWKPLDHGLGEYMNIIRSMPHSDVADIAVWCGTAVFGLCQAVATAMVPVAASTLASWTVLELRKSDLLPAVLESCQRIVVQFAPDVDLLREVVLRIVTTLRQVGPAEHLAGTVIPLFQGLSAEQHNKAIEIFLTSP